MSSSGAPQHAPSARTAVGSAAVVWAAAVLMGIAIGLFAPVGQRGGWVSLALGGSLVLSFAVQLFVGRPEGFITRVALSMLGALVILAVIGGAFGLVAMAARG